MNHVQAPLPRPCSMMAGDDVRNGSEAHAGAALSSAEAPARAEQDHGDDGDQHDGEVDFQLDGPADGRDPGRRATPR
jgi:hypothetical protein